MTDADDPRVLRAARIVAEEDIAIPILVGEPSSINAAAAAGESGSAISAWWTPPPIPRATATPKRLGPPPRRGVTTRGLPADSTGIFRRDDGGRRRCRRGGGRGNPALPARHPARPRGGRERGRRRRSRHLHDGHADRHVRLADCTVNINPDAGGWPRLPSRPPTSWSTWASSRAWRCFVFQFRLGAPPHAGKVPRRSRGSARYALTSRLTARCRPTPRSWNRS